MGNQKRFFFQTIQDTVALYYRIPVRQFDLLSKDKIFLYCKNICFLNLEYESQEKFMNSLAQLIRNIPDFLKDIKTNLLLQNLKKIDDEELEVLKEYLTFTRSSFSPFFIRALNESKSITVLKIAFHIYLLFSSNHRGNHHFRELSFLNHSYKIYHDDKKLYIFGPIMTDKAFDSDDMRVAYTTRIKDFFDLQLHTLELVNLINHRNRLKVNKFNKKTENMIKALLVVENYFDFSREYKKQELRKIAIDFILENSKNKDRDYIETRVKNNHTLRDLRG